MCSFGVHPHEASASDNRTSAEQAAFDMDMDHVSTSISFYCPNNMDHIVHL